MAGFRLPTPRSPRWKRPSIGLYNFNVQVSRSGSDVESEAGSVNSRTRDNGVVMYTISIPKNVVPGEEFQVLAGFRIVRVRCPSGFSPGQAMRITVPKDEDVGGSRRAVSELPPDSDGVTRVPYRELIHGESAAYMVRIPEGVRGGQDFSVTINGRPLTVTCPNSGFPGMFVRVVPPSPEDDDDKSPLDRTSSTLSSSSSFRRAHLNQSESTQMFEVAVPKGVKPGNPFSINAGGVRVLVTCPKNASCGQKIRFQLPKGLLNRPAGPRSKLAEIKLSYDKDGWTRTVRASDLKFVWTRFDEDGNVEERTRFDTERSAYVLRLDFTDDSHHLREGLASLVTPDQAVADSKVKRDDGSDLVTYSDIAAAQVKSYADKVQWFRNQCDQLRVHRDEGEMKINIRREYLLGDSIDAIMSLSRRDLRKTWRFEYIGEAGLDVGGLKTEWFQLVTELLFDPQFGLWKSSTTNQMCMEINPASELCCPEDHLLCFRFLGRVMGKALFDKELVQGHMVKHIYKHILGFPVMLKDLNDEVYSKSLESLKDMGADVEHLYVDFAVTEELLGMKQKVELIPNGENISLTEDNLPEYIEACLKYRLLGQCEKQMNELLLGFYDVIESPLLTVFDFQELELLMCGLPTIDLGDWIEHTEYMGEYEMEGRNHEVCNWFWEAVNGYDQEIKARLLQFVTGTSGVPALGFGFLQGNDGNIRNFTIHGVDLETCVYPRAHTCFNRIDLPLYKTRAELEEKLKIAITMAATGFDIE